MKRKLKVAVSSFLAFIMIVCAFASERDYDAEIEKLNREIEAAQKRQEERNVLINQFMNDVNKQDELQRLVQEQVDEIEAKVKKQGSLIEAKQNDIELKIASLDHLEAEIVERQKDIRTKQSIIAQKEKENKENLLQFGEIVKVMYMTEDLDPMAQIMGSGDFFDLLVRSEMIENIGKKNIEFMNNLLEEIEEQKNLIAKLEENILKLESDKERAQEEKLVLEADKLELSKEHKKLEQQMHAEYNELYGIISQKESLRNKINFEKRENDKDAQLQEEANRMVAELIRQQQRANAGLPIFSSDDFLWPLDPKYKMITCHFGYDPWRGGNHYGLDIGNSGINGANIYAVQSGTVLTAAYGWNGGYGNYVIIDHGDGVSTLYAHGQAGSIAVSKGDTVDRGQVIMKVGSTGWSTGAHLHFEVRVDGVAQNPLNYNYK